jgi:hemolysin III
MDTLLGERPAWRGLIHRGAAVGFAIAFLVLYADARRVGHPGDTTAVAVYGLGVTAMFAVSAIYHASAATPSRLSRVLQRADHGTILLAIAGTYTAVTHMAVRTGPRHLQLLVAIWVVAGIGIAIRVFLPGAPRALGAALYFVVGWFALFDLPAYLRGTTTEQMAWIVIGGVLYTVGGVVYALKRPDPSPRHFGYHEVFHAFTVVGALAHYVAVTLLLHAPNVP